MLTIAEQEAERLLRAEERSRRENLGARTQVTAIGATELAAIIPPKIPRTEAVHPGVILYAANSSSGVWGGNARRRGPYRG